MYRAVYRFLSRQMKTPSELPLCCRCDWVSHTLARFLAHRAVQDCTEGKKRAQPSRVELRLWCAQSPAAQADDVAVATQKVTEETPCFAKCCAKICGRQRCKLLQDVCPPTQKLAEESKAQMARAHKLPFVARKSPHRDCLRPEPCFAGCLALARPPLSDRSLCLWRRLTSAQFLRRHWLLVGAAMGFTMPGRPIGDLQDAGDMRPREAHHLDRCVLNSGGSVQLTGAPPAPVAGPTPVKAVAADVRPAAWTSFRQMRGP